MSHAAPVAVIRHCDVAVIGGSAAGLAAALQLARQRRSVIVIDSGKPRNAQAAHMHSFLGRDGTPPATLLAEGRADVRKYGGEVLSGRAATVTRDGDRFRVELAAGQRIVARRIVLAAGLADELPPIDGLTEHWGGAVIHCPFCHGYEVRDQRIVQLVTHPMGLHAAPLFRQLTARLTLVVLCADELDGAELDHLRAAGVDVRASGVRRITSNAEGRLDGVELIDGSRLAADAVAVASRVRPRVEALLGLGLRTDPHPSGLGDVVNVDAAGATSVAGVYAAGSITDPSQQVLPAAAHGSRVGAAVAFDLAAEDVHTAGHLPGHAADWDQRYSGEQLWSGNPIGSLLAEVSDLASGRALDVGAGEGGDAMWLADRGWIVTANDISLRALDRLQAEASRRGLHVTCLPGDANGFDTFPREAFDLVTASYASILRTPDLRGVRNLLDAVAPGGTLLVLNHDLAAMSDPQHGHPPFDREAYVHTDDVRRALDASPAWVIEVDERRPRPPGAAGAAHHVDDVILRARRVG